MARFFQAHRKSLSFFISKTLIPPQHQHHQFFLQSNKSISNFLPQFSRNHFSSSPSNSNFTKPPFEHYLLQNLQNEIEYHSQYVQKDIEPVTKFDAFTLEARPYKNWVTLKGKSARDENIKLEATMFDGYETTGSDLKLHISLLVDITKGDGSNLLKFACSAWPDRLEIHKVFIFSGDETLANPYSGPKFSVLDKKLQNAFHEFLKARGINDDLLVFLHEYMMDKGKIELLQWFEYLKNVIGK